MHWFSLIYCSSVMLSLAIVFFVTTRSRPEARLVGSLFALLWVLGGVSMALPILLQLGFAIPMWLIHGMIVPLLALTIAIFVCARRVPPVT